MTEESNLHKTQYGLGRKDQYYVCEACNMSASASNMMDHIKVRAERERQILGSFFRQILAVLETCCVVSAL